MLAASLLEGRFTEKLFPGQSFCLAKKTKDLLLNRNLHLLEQMLGTNRKYSPNGGLPVISHGRIRKTSLETSKRTCF